LTGSAILGTVPNLDLPHRTTEIEFTGKLRDYQVDVEAEAYQQLETYGTTTIGLYPGFGKTALGAHLACRLRFLTLILCHREILLQQWQATFASFTTATVQIVGQTSRLETSWDSIDIIICMDERVQLIPETVRNQVGFLLIDEAHAFCVPSRLKAILAFTPRFICIETATLERDDEMHVLMYALVGTHGVFRESERSFQVYKVETGVQPDRTYMSNGTIQYTDLMQKTLRDPGRNQRILDHVLANQHRKIMILTLFVDHALQLHALLEEKGVDTDYLCGRKKTYRPCQTLIGTCSKIGTGFDASSASLGKKGSNEPADIAELSRAFDLLLLVCSIKKYSMLVQNVGRIFRADFPIIIQFVDGDPIFETHWRKARAWYKKRNGTVIETDTKIIVT
jgi:superfamily II DNA or RNA helicase